MTDTQYTSEQRQAIDRTCYEKKGRLISVQHLPKNFLGFQLQHETGAAIIVVNSILPRAVRSLVIRAFISGEDSVTDIGLSRLGTPAAGFSFSTLYPPAKGGKRSTEVC